MNAATISTKRIEDAVANLLVSKPHGSGVRLSVPVLYPSGAFASVEISIQGDRCFVSDCALGMLEAEMSSAQDHYIRTAKAVAKQMGIGFDGVSLFILTVPIDRVAGAVVCVANASVMAVSKAVHDAADEHERRSNNNLYELVSSYFGPQRVLKMAEIQGRNVKWPVHNLVIISGDRKAVFEFVTKQGGSVAAKYLTFSDIYKADVSISLNAVASDVDALGAKGAMLADVSNIIPFNAPKETFVRFAEGRAA